MIPGNFCRDNSFMDWTKKDTIKEIESVAFNSENRLIESLIEQCPEDVVYRGFKSLLPCSCVSEQIRQENITNV